MLHYVCLQDKDPTDLSRYCADLLHGNGYTRWFDKSLTVTVFGNARVCDDIIYYDVSFYFSLESMLSTHGEFVF